MNNVLPVPSGLLLYCTFVSGFLLHASGYWDGGLFEQVIGEKWALVTNCSFG